MSLHIHRSNRIESLFQELRRVVAELGPRDPFVPVAIVVGSQGMARWLRYEFATHEGTTSRMEFPFSGQALDGAVRWLTAPGNVPPGPNYWSSVRDEGGRGWGKKQLVAAVIERIRAHREDEHFHRVRRYLEVARPVEMGRPAQVEGAEVVRARELGFAGQVADVLDRLLHDRHRIALEWARAPGEAPPEHRWLAALLHDLEVHEDPSSPARLLEACECLTTPPPWAAETKVLLFGLSTLGAGDRARVQAIARHVDVHLFMTVPSDVWWRDIHDSREQVRELQGITAYEEYAARVREYESQNPLLASLGMPSRDVQVWLEGLDYEGDQVATAETHGDRETWLHTIQEWIRRAGTREDLAESLRAVAPLESMADVSNEGDTSLGFHATFGPMRQCEVLRDRLLERLEEDRTLEPRHILVMTPDVDTYGPLVSAVFGRTGIAVCAAGDEGAAPRRLPTLPVNVSDRGLTQTNSVAEVMLQVLHLAGERITGGAVLDLLGLEPLRRRFGLEHQDLETLRGLVVDSNMRWGFDAEDRARAEQPLLDSHTLRFGLERLALGALMPDATMHVSMATPTGDPRGADVVGAPIRTPEQRRCAGVLAQVIGLLEDATAQCAHPGDCGAWRRRLEKILATFTETTEDAAWLTREVVERLERMEEELGGAEEEPLLLSRDAVVQWIKRDFEIPQRGDRAITGAITVCAMQPMRSVPFRVVALLGMDDGAFPRGGVPKTWDPFGARRPGERDNREIDRHLLLEAILSARDHFMVLWSGFHVRSGDKLPAAVPVEELLEVLQEAWERGRAGEDTKAGAGEQTRMVRAHPLQPWGLGTNVHAHPRVLDARLKKAAQTIEAQRRGEEPVVHQGLAVVEDGDGVLTAEAHPPQSVSLGQLARGLRQPQKLYLKERLGIYYGEASATPESREPLELDGLKQWSLKDDALALLGELPETTDAQSRISMVVDRLYGRLRGEGRLPLAAGGKVVLTRACKEILPVHAAMEATRGILMDDGVAISIDAGDVRIVGTLQDLRVLETATGTRLLHSVGSASSVNNVRRRLTAWLTLLAGRASGLELEVELLGAPSSRSNDPYGQFGLSTPTLDADAARAQLVALARLWMRLRSEPLPLFEHTSLNVATVLHEEEVEVDAAAAGEPSSASYAAAREGMHGGYRGRADLHDPYTAAVFHAYDIEHGLAQEGNDSVRGLAARLWLPLLKAVEDRESFEGRWRRP